MKNNYYELDDFLLKRLIGFPYLKETDNLVRILHIRSIPINELGLTNIFLEVHVVDSSLLPEEVLTFLKNLKISGISSCFVESFDL